MTEPVCWIIQAGFSNTKYDSIPDVTFDANSNEMDKYLKIAKSYG